MDDSFAFAYKLMPTDSDMIEYLKLKIQSKNFSIPTWYVHEVVDFCNHKPQQLADTYKAASDGNWYFLTSIPPIRSENAVDWKATDVHTPMERHIYNEADGKPLGFKFSFEFLDDNNQKWGMCLYRAPDLVNRKVSEWTFGKIYKHIEEEEEDEEEELEVTDDEADVITVTLLASEITI